MICVISLFADELPIHGFGVKTQGLAAYSSQLASADSLPWPLDARRSDPLPGQAHKSCASCMEYAAHWRSQLLDRWSQPSSMRVSRTSFVSATGRKLGGS